MMHEFRNQLRVLMAAATELRADIPAALALQVGEAVGETERGVQSLSSLLALVDAQVCTVEPLIADLDGVIARAVRLASPSLGRRVSVKTVSGRSAGVKNRGAALESLLAALIGDLARATHGAGLEASRPSQIRVEPEIGRGCLTIEIASDGPRPAPDSWRYLLACDLAAKLDANITLAVDAAAYVVQVR